MNLTERRTIQNLTPDAGPFPVGYSLGLTRIQRDRDGSGYDVSTIRVPMLTPPFNQSFETILFPLDGSDPIGPQVLQDEQQAIRFHSAMVALVAESLV